MEKEQILIIEDDPDIREGVRILLESENYEVREAPDGAKGLAALEESTDLVILDVMMPGMSGLCTCREIRKRSYVPVLFLTAKAQESDKLIGLMAGGDDYLAKPFSYTELLARVKALLRRYRVYSGKKILEGDGQEEYLEAGDIRLHKEYNQARNLYESIWEEPYFYNCNSTVTVHIRKLRLKIEEDPQNPRRIQTVWGKGYRFDGSA